MDDTINSKVKATDFKNDIRAQQKVKLKPSDDRLPPQIKVKVPLIVTNQGV